MSRLPDPSQPTASEPRRRIERAVCGVNKVIFVNRFFHPDESATSQMLSDLAFELARGGRTIHVVCSRQLYGDPAARLPYRENLSGVLVRRIWTTRFGRYHLLGRAVDYLTFYLSCLVTLLWVVRRGDTVVAKTDPPLISVVAAVVAKVKGATLVNWLQDIFPEVASVLGANPLPRPLDGWLRRLRDYSLKMAPVNVVLGGRMRERLLERGIASEQIRIISNWAELGPKVPKSPEQSDLRNALDLRGRFIIAYSGNLGRAHECETMLAAADALRKEPRFVFLIIGAGAGMRSLKLAAAGRGLENIRFVPFQPRTSLNDSLAAADLHWVSLIPALEGLIVPSKFYGILAVARPVIFVGDKDGEIARIVTDTRCGVAVVPGDAAAFAAAIREFDKDPALRLRAGMNGYERFLKQYSLEGASLQWQDVLSQACKRSA